MDWADILSKSLRKVYSQNGEEGLIDRLFDSLGTTNKVLVDIGAGDGFKFSNTRSLLEQGWSGSLFDSAHENESVRREHITAENVCDVLLKHKVPYAFDFLSLDIDGVDWYVLRALLRGGFRPRIFVCEINTDLPAYPPVAVVYDPKFKFSSCNYFGASLGAFQVLGSAHRFTCVYVHGINAFFASEELVSTPGRCRFHPAPAWGPDPLKRPWYEIRPGDTP